MERVQRRALPEFNQDLAGFVGMLRSQVFSSQQKAARHFGLSRSTVVRYENGSLKPPVGYIAGLARLRIERMARSEQTEKEAQQQKLLRTINQALTVDQLDIPFRDWAELTAIAETYYQERHQAAGKPGSHRRQSLDWTTHLFDGLLGLNLQISQAHLLKFALGLGIWYGGWQLLAPFLSWPFTDLPTAWAACARYGLVSLMVPLSICGLLALNDQQRPLLASTAALYKLWVLRAGAAFVGFHIVTAIWLGGLLVFFSASLWPFPNWFLATSIAVIILIVYAIVKQMPSRRIAQQAGAVTFFGFDYAVLLIFAGFGPLTAYFFYLAYPLLHYPVNGGGALIAGLILTIFIARLADDAEASNAGSS